MGEFLAFAELLQKKRKKKSIFAFHVSLSVIEKDGDT